jgi:hypothetical protein
MYSLWISCNFGTRTLDFTTDDHRDHCDAHDYILSIGVLLKYINIDFESRLDFPHSFATSELEKYSNIGVF